ncbi:MAG: hypothetical protein ABIR47_12455 [Candidatus Kapaibacterium sp.]
MMPSHLFNILLVCVCALAFAPARTWAQTGADSLRIESRIALERSDLSFAASARFMLLRELGERDIRGVRDLLAFMGRRRSPDGSSWLSPAERLIAETIAADTLLVRNFSRLESLLSTAAIGPRQSMLFNDKLYARQQEVLKRDADVVASRFDQFGPSAVERVFYNLLINNQFSRGYRAQEELNNRIDTFQRHHPAEPLAQLAGEYFRKIYWEVDYGAGFMAGYTVGTFDKRLGERLNLFHGPVLSGELYFHRITMAGTAMFGTARAPSSFVAGGEEWNHGDLPCVTMSLDFGYEIRTGRFAITPMAGIAGLSVMSADSGAAGSLPLGDTHTRIGYDVAAIVGYRIPSDVGPHIDLRFVVGRRWTGLGDYDPSFAGSLWYLHLAFALIQRPYRGR